MIVDGHVHIGKSTRLQIDMDGEGLVRIADSIGVDKLCCTDLTALFYDMHEGNRLLFEGDAPFPGPHPRLRQLAFHALRAGGPG